MLKSSASFPVLIADDEAPYGNEQTRTSVINDNIQILVDDDKPFPHIMNCAISKKQITLYLYVIHY